MPRTNRVATVADLMNLDRMLAVICISGTVLAASRKVLLSATLLADTPLVVKRWP
jgi:hypothetical protein